MSFPRISIITPSYNQGAFLEQTIDSVLSQGYPNLEYFVVDGGSTDNSLEIIKKHAKHLTWWVSEKDKGQSHAINKGLSRATGEIINWINSDDYYEPDALKTVARAFENPEVSMACFRANVFGLQKRISRGTDIFPANLAKTIAYTRIDQPETFFRKSAVDRMGLLNENLHYCMDKEWLFRYLLIFGQEHIYKSEEIILNFRYHEASKSVSQKRGFETEADLIYRNFAERFGSSRDVKMIHALLESAGERKIPFNWPTEDIEIGANLTHQVMNYYAYKRFRVKYEALEVKDNKSLMEFIDPDLLEPHDAKMYAKLAKRVRNLPPAAIRVLRKFTR